MRADELYSILLPDGPISDSEKRVFVIDWELAQVSSLAFDLGQMFAELYQLKHFKDIDAGVWLIEAFMRGYGPIEEDVAFRVAVHVGVHLICWGSRVAGWGTEGQVEDVVGLGTDGGVFVRMQDFVTDRLEVAVARS